MGVVGAPEVGDGAGALGAFAGAGVGFDALQGRALARRQQVRGQRGAMQPFEVGQREHRGVIGELLAAAKIQPVMRDKRIRFKAPLNR